MQDGALRQTAEKEFVRALAGDKAWTDYTLELKARKLPGARDSWFSSTSTTTRIASGGILAAGTTPSTAWNWARRSGQARQRRGGRWYDIKVEVSGTSIKCSLDGQVIHDVKNARETTPGLFASATRDNQSGEIIVKVVNAAATPTVTEINLNGGGKLAASAQAIVLTSGSPKDENSLDEPTKVAPKTQTLALSGPNFQHSFPANSLTVLRVKAEK